MAYIISQWFQFIQFDSYAIHDGMRQIVFQLAMIVFCVGGYKQFSVMQ